MECRRMRKAMITILLISLALLTVDAFSVVRGKSYSFTAAISPKEVGINEPVTYSMNITNTGDSALGSTSVTIPEGFDNVSSITILDPPSTWNCTLSTTAINLSATSGGSVISQNESVVFTFDAIAPDISGIATWTVEATTNAEGAGVELTLEGEQPTVTVIAPFSAPTISVSLSVIDQRQFSLLSQLNGASGGVPPYSHQWLQAYDGGVFSPIPGANGLDHTFSPTTSTATGTWSFRLDVTDNSSVPATVTSNTIDVIVNSELTPPEVKATPEVISQDEPSTLTTSTVTTGTSPYAYEWFQKAPGEDYARVGDNSTSYIFAGTATVGTWTFLLQVTDDTGASVNSTVEVIVSSTPVFLITVTQTAHGTISPETTSVVFRGNQSFTVSPDTGYQIADVLVNGISVGPLASFVFVDVTADQNLTATYIQTEYTLTISPLGNGIVTPSPLQVMYHYGDVVQLTAIPASGWRFSDWTGALTGTLNPSSVTINGNMSITASFLVNQYTIDAFAGEGGSITPSGTMIVDHGGSQTYTIVPSTGYHISDILVDGVSLGVVTSHSFTEVAANHNITANFAINADYYLVSVVSSHGSPTPSGQVNAGDSFTASVASPEGDTNHRWICTGYSLDGGAPVLGIRYTFTNVQANHMITFNWQEQYYLNVVSPVGSTIGAGWYNMGATLSVSVSSNVITGEDGTRQVFTGWTGDAIGTDITSNPLTIDGPKTATAMWKTQYLVTFIQYGLASDASGNIITVLGETKTLEQLPTGVWIDAGDSVTFGYVATVESTETDKRYTLGSTNSSSPFTADQPTTIWGFYELHVYSSGFAPSTFALVAVLISVPPLVAVPLLVRRRKNKGPKEITPVTSEGGSISPSTAQTVENGMDSIVFIITADSGYKIADVVVDSNVHLGAVRTYKFTNVTKNHTISAIFQKE